jgi:hypothetical protein
LSLRERAHEGVAILERKGSEHRVLKVVIPFCRIERADPPERTDLRAVGRHRRKRCRHARKHDAHES